MNLEMKKNKFVLIIGCIMIASISCSQFNASAGDYNLNNVHITIKNIGTIKILDATVRFDKSVVRSGIIPPNGSATHLNFENPISKEAKVVCIMQNEDTFERTISMSEIKNFLKENDVSIFFNIDTDKKEVSVKFFKGLIVK